MELPKRLLVATDHSASAERAGEVAVAWAKRLGAELHWVQGVEQLSDVTPPHSEPLIASYVERLRQAADEKLAQLAAGARRQALVCETHLVDAPAAHGVVALAREIDADCVVVGTRGLTRLRHLLLGSVAERIVRRAHCGVLLVRGERSPLEAGTIVLGDDLTPLSAAARESAVALATALGVSLDVVHAVDLGAGFRSVLEATLVDRVMQEASGEARRRLDELFAGHPGCEISRVLLREPPADALADYADRAGAGLVVVGSREQHDLKDRLLGSVAERVVRHAPCSVWVVRRSAGGS